jgi:DNA primase
VRGVADARVSTPITWDEIADVDPADFTIATVPQRFAEVGDLHAGIDGAVFAIDPLLEWADRDEREGAEDAGDPDEPQD